MVYLLTMVIFYSYVKLPEDKYAVEHPIFQLMVFLGVAVVQKGTSSVVTDLLWESWMGADQLLTGEFGVVPKEETHVIPCHKYITCAYRILYEIQVLFWVNPCELLSVPANHASSGYQSTPKHLSTTPTNRFKTSNQSSQPTMASIW